MVGMNTTASTLDSGTVVLPTGLLLVHPGVSTVSTPNDSIVQWTAPVAGVYSISGFFEVLDTDTRLAHPVFVGIYDNSTLNFHDSLFLPRATGFPTNTPGQNDPFFLKLSLNAGDVISFGVNNGTSVFDDSTGLDATITLPEPSSLALFGSALIGLAAIRRRKRKTA